MSACSTGGTVVKYTPVKAGDTGDTGSILGLGRSPGEWNGNSLQYSCIWKIPWTEEPDGLQSMGLQRDGHDWVSCIALPLMICFFVHLENASVQLISVPQSCKTLCDPMDCSMPGFPVHHQLPELAQTHVHWVSDTIQPSHPLSSLSPPVFNLSQHQDLFQWVSYSH